MVFTLWGTETDHENKDMYARELDKNVTLYKLCFENLLVCVVRAFKLVSERNRKLIRVIWCANIDG